MRFYCLFPMETMFWSTNNILLFDCSSENFVLYVVHQNQNRKKWFNSNRFSLIRVLFLADMEQEELVLESENKRIDQAKHSTSCKVDEIIEIGQWLALFLLSWKIRMKYKNCFDYWFQGGTDLSELQMTIKSDWKSYFLRWDLAYYINISI